jgi:glucose-1-phosphate thymidylyltransferase
VQTIESRTGIKIGCPEEAAFRSGFLNISKLTAIAESMPNCEYRAYLEEVVKEEARGRRSEVGDQRSEIRSQR